jgi:hypothetical protein
MLSQQMLRGHMAKKLEVRYRRHSIIYPEDETTFMYNTKDADGVSNTLLSLNLTIRMKEEKRHFHFGALCTGHLYAGDAIIVAIGSGVAKP